MFCLLWPGCLPELWQGNTHLLSLSWWAEATTSLLITTLNRINFYSFPLRQGGVELSFQTLLSFPGVPERGKTLGVDKVVWVLQLNRHLSGFQSLEWTALANPEITEAVSFSKPIELVWAGCCQPFWVLGLDTSLVQVMSAVPAPKACPGMAVAFSGVHTVFSFWLSLEWGD